MNIKIMFFFIVYTQINNGMEPENFNLNDPIIKEYLQCLSPKEQNDFKYFALLCAALQNWFAKNIYFDEFQIVKAKLADLGQRELSEFKTIFSNLENDMQCALRIQLHRNLTPLNCNNNDITPAKYLDELLSLCGYEDNQPKEYEQLPRNLRSFYSRFKGWPQVEQDEAILRGIENHQIPGFKRKEFCTVKPEDRKKLSKLFETIGYAIDDPTKSTALHFKTIQETQKEKLKQLKFESKKE